MSQMVLPQNLQANTSTEPAGAPASARPGGEKSGDSPFDQVSRSEQKKLDDKRLEQSRAADRASDHKQEASNADADKAARADNAAPSDSTRDTEAREPRKEVASDSDDTALASDNAQQPEQKTDEAPNPFLALNDESDVPATETTDDDGVAVTFAGLQSLVPGATGSQTPAGDAVTGGKAGAAVQGIVMSMAGLANGGRNAVAPGQSSGQKGVTVGLALTESLLSGAGLDDGKPTSDSPMLQNAIRFQGALDTLTGQANPQHAQKMAPDAPVLRGYATSIDVPVGHAEWGDKMAGKLTFLTARNMSVAEIHLTPPDLGPMEVKVHVQQDQANITVHSANPVVRDQLELHSHRLRDMLSEQGFSLAQFDVSDSGSQQGQSGDGGDSDGGSEGLMAATDLDESTGDPQTLDLTWKGEVDIFA